MAEAQAAHPLAHHDFFTALGPFPPSPHLAVAVSGGADSMALALLAHRWAQSRGGRITALTIDHGLRPESRAEAEQVAAWMRAHAIDHHILTPAHTGPTNNLQEAARRWRYDALAQWCHRNGILHCLLAHHAGDQRETIALHTARGDTADGPSGMAAQRHYRGIRFLRPLLGVEKEMLQHFLHIEQQPWVEDPSNQNTDFARVRMRQQLAEDAAMRDALTRTTTESGHARAARETAHAVHAAAIVTLHPTGFATFAREAWMAFEPTFASGLLADLLTTISSAIHRPRASDTQRLAEALRTSTTKRTLHSCEITHQRGTIRIARETSRVAPPIALSGTGQTVWDQRFHAHHTLPDGVELTLRALGHGPLQREFALPPATPSLWHLDECLFVPHIAWAHPDWPQGASVRIGFAPVKPLAAAAFWCLN